MKKHYLIFLIVFLYFLNCSLKNSNLKADEYYTRGVKKYEAKDYIGAINDFEKAIELDDKDIASRLYIGLAKLKLEKYTNAIQDFNKCIAIDPKYFNPYLYRGIAKFHLKDYRNAIKDFDRVLEILKGEDFKAHYYRGMCKVELGDIKAGCEDFCRAKKYEFEKAIEAFDKLNCASYTECKKRELTEEEKKRREKLKSLLEKMGEESEDKN